MRIRSAALSALVLLFAGAALSAGKPPAKPRLNGWLALYDLTRRIGTPYTGGISLIHSPARMLDVDGGTIWVPVATTAEPMAGDTCHIEISGAWESPKVCPGCDSIPGFDKDNYQLFHDDKGCKGEFATLRQAPLPDDANSREILIPRLRYMRTWLTPRIYDYLGLLYLQHARQMYRKD